MDWHYGERGRSSCGSDEPDMALTNVAVNVTCRRCIAKQAYSRAVAPSPEGQAGLREIIAEMRTWSEAVSDVALSPDMSAHEAALVLPGARRAREWADRLAALPPQADARTQGVDERTPTCHRISGRLGMKR